MKRTVAGIMMTQETARAYWRFTVIWMIAGSISGILCALSIIAPETLSSYAILGYGRIVAVHRALMIYGVLFGAVFASAYSLLPRLSYSETVDKRKSLLLAWAGNIVILAGVIHLFMGMGSGREYSDFPTFILLLYWVWLLAVAMDILTLSVRTGSVKFTSAAGLIYIAALIPAVVFPFAIPAWWGSEIFEAIRTWIGWRAIFIGVFTLSALGVAIWSLGRVRPVVRLQKAWIVTAVLVLALLGPATGFVHLLEAPIINGLKAIGAFAGIMTAAALLVFIAAIWKGKFTDAPGLLYFAGLTAIGITCLQGVVMVIPPVQTAFHFTSGTAAHAHMALGGILMVMLMGAMLIAPRLGKRRLVQSEKTVIGAGWLIAGLAIVCVSLSTAGVLQASAFSQVLALPDWMPMFRWMYFGVLAGGIAFFTGALILGGIIIKTLSQPVPVPDVQSSHGVMAHVSEVPEGGEG